MKILRVIQPENRNHNFTKLDDVKNAIFLAGPCPRDNYEDDWRPEAIKILQDLKFDGIVLNPTNPYYNEKDPDHLAKQTNWEIEAMYKASAIVFWIERDENHPALTTNFEFGHWFDKDGAYVGWSRKAIKNNYFQVICDMTHKKRFATLETMLKQVVQDLNRPAKKWFLSDTHFSQERTLELSKRPFSSVEQMDLEIISNWNKTVRKNDQVYFLGDFGASFEYLKLLNFKTLHFILGNYERKDADKNDITEKSIKALQKIDGVKIYKDRGECKITLSNGQEVVLMHEPIDPDGKTDFSGDVCLYGHIHGRQFYKRNGTDVAVDIHWFKPISEEEIEWRLNAIKFLDQNVWTADCI